MFYRSHAAGRRFESDEEAFDHVLAWAASGSAFHMRAIVMVMREQFK